MNNENKTVENNSVETINEIKSNEEMNKFISLIDNLKNIDIKDDDNETKNIINIMYYAFEEVHRPPNIIDVKLLNKIADVANNGNIYAFYILSEIYDNGYGSIKMDEKLGREYLDKSANLGNTYACWKVVEYIECCKYDRFNDMASFEDKARIIELLHIIENKKHEPYVQYLLADNYLCGNGCEQDLIKSMQYLSMALKKENEDDKADERDILHRNIRDKICTVQIVDSIVELGKLKIENEKLKEENERLQTELDYRPDGKGYLEAKNDFEDLVK